MRLIRASALAAVALGMLAVPASAAAPAAASWSMNESSGSVMTDGTGHGNNGALKNITLGVPGVAGTGYGFNGRSSRVIVPNAASLNPGDADITVTVHVATTTLPPEDYDLIRKGLQSTSGGDYKIEIVNVSGVAEARCYFRGSRDSYQKTVAVPNLLNGAYHTIVCSKTTAKVTMTVDGTTYRHTTTIGSISNSSDLIVGARSAGTSSDDWFKGSLDELGIVIGG